MWYLIIKSNNDCLYIREISDNKKELLTIATVANSYNTLASNKSRTNLLVNFVIHESELELFGLEKPK